MQAPISAWAFLTEQFEEVREEAQIIAYLSYHRLPLCDTAVYRENYKRCLKLKLRAERLIQLADAEQEGNSQPIDVAMLQDCDVPTPLQLYINYPIFRLRCLTAIQKEAIDMVLKLMASFERLARARGQPGSCGCR